MRNQISEQILRILASGDVTKDFRYDIREINILVNQYRDYFIREYYYRDKQLEIQEDFVSNYINDKYVQSFKNIKVLFDEDLGLNYSILPAIPMDLDSKGGIYFISFMQSQYKPFIPVGASFLALSYGTERANLGGNIGYWRENDRIYYTRFNCKINDVLIKMIAESNSLSNDNFNIPAHLQTLVIEKIVALLGSRMQLPEQIKNDNISL